jgi:hypothetical protein
MKTKSMIAIAVAALIPMGAAIAGDGHKDKSGSMGPSFDTLDANKDGRISQTEAAMDANLVFSTADKNSDGYLDKVEWKSHAKTGTTPQPQSMPDAASDQTVPEAPPASEPQPDTETPRQ